MTTSQNVVEWMGDYIGYLGAGLAYLVAGIHLFHPKRGFPRLALLVRTGNTSLLLDDPRPIVFVVSGLGILVGIKLVILDVERKRVYALGMVLVATYFAGYFVWHLSGHGGFLPGRKPLYHGLHPVEAVVSHLVGYPLARLSKLAEAALLVVLAVLYRQESRREDPR